MKLITACTKGREILGHKESTNVGGGRSALVESKPPGNLESDDDDNNNDSTNKDSGKNAHEKISDAGTDAMGRSAPRLAGVAGTLVAFNHYDGDINIESGGFEVCV